MAAESLRSTLLPTTASDSAPAARSKNFPGSKYNHNVVVNWLLKVSTGMADSIWSGTVLASYLYELMGQSNSFAGYVEAAQGVASLVVALPVGWLADRGSKARIIAIGGIMLPGAVAATSFAVIYGVDHQDDRLASFLMFVGALSLWGAVQAIQNGPAQALYADSTAAGERSKYYMISFVLYLCASVLGPMLTITLFVLHGDTWDLVSLRNVFLVGMAPTQATRLPARRFRWTGWQPKRRGQPRAKGKGDQAGGAGGRALGGGGGGGGPR